MTKPKLSKKTAIFTAKKSKSLIESEPPPESSKHQPQKKKTSPPKISLVGISKSKSASPVVEASSTRSSTPPTKEKNIYTKSNFIFRDSFFNDFIRIHKGIDVFLGERMEIFSQKLDERFFQWLNHKNNSWKMMYEIKKEFMLIADELLLFEVMNEQRKQTSSRFVIGPFQKILESFSNESPENQFIPINFKMWLKFPENSQTVPIPQMARTYSKPLFQKIHENLPPVLDLEYNDCHIIDMENHLDVLTEFEKIDDIENDFLSFFK